MNSVSFQKHINTISRLIISASDLFLSFSLFLMQQHGEQSLSPQPTDAWSLALTASLPALIAQTIGALQTPSQSQSQLNSAEWRAAAANTIGSLVFFVGPQVRVGGACDIR
jgi:hypothetical protein